MLPFLTYIADTEVFVNFELAKDGSLSHINRIFTISHDPLDQWPFRNLTNVHPATQKALLALAKEENFNQ